MLPPFQLERYFAPYEFSVPYLLCSSDCESMSAGDLLALEPNALSDFQDLWLGYTEYAGHPALREQIASLYSGISADEVMVFTGAEEAIFVFMNSVLTPEDHVIVHYPGYQSLYQIAESMGCSVSRWEARAADNWKLGLEDLIGLLRPNTRWVVINCPHNPTGYLMPPDEWTELVRLSEHYGFRIFSDEVYRGLEYDEADRLPAACEGDDRSVSLGVMSKSFGLAGLRIGWISTRNRAVHDRLAVFKDYTTICNSAPSEFLATLALRHRETIIARNRALIVGNLPLVEEFFAGHGDVFEWIPPRAGPIAFPRYKREGIEAFCHRLAHDAGILLLPGTVYDAGSNHFRIGFGRRNLPECLAQLENYLRRENLKTK